MLIDASSVAASADEIRAGAVSGIIFDMDGTIIDSMPSHAQSWVAFVQNHGIDIDVPDLMRRTTGRTGAECMRELFARDMSDEEAWQHIAEKEHL